MKQQADFYFAAMNSSTMQQRRVLTSIRSKLLLSFTIFTLITLSVILTAFWFNAKRDQVAEILQITSNIRINIQVAEKMLKDFSTDEAINQKFHHSGKSSKLDKQITALNAIRADLNYLRLNDRLAGFDQVDEQINEVVKCLDKHEILLEQFVELIKKRGFKNFGIEGKMREAIHEVENNDLQLNKTILLSVRRHEKDFIIRKEPQYIQRLSEAVKELYQDIDRHQGNAQQKANFKKLVQSYHNAFLELVDTEEKIGFDSQKGIRGAIGENSEQIALHLADLINRVNQQAQKVRNQIRVILIFVVFGSIGLSVALGIFITNVLSRPIKKLSASINETIQKDFNEQTSVYQVDTHDEVGLLSKDTSLMLAKMKNSIAEIRQKGIALEESQRLIMDSLRYAQTIQEAVLPDHEDLIGYLDDYLLIFKPQQIVSGDFYWIFKKNDSLFVAVVDCTGHGVPGAFMSLIGRTLLDKIVVQNKIYDPLVVLEVLHTEIYEALKQEKSENTDGMDVCFCRIDSEEGTDFIKKVTYAGAKRPLYYIHQGEFYELKGSKGAIGGKRKEKHGSLQSDVIYLQKGDLLYLTTDGYADQHNANRLKFSSAKLKELISTIHPLPFEMQKETLLAELQTHSEGERQRDDITILGLRL